MAAIAGGAGGEKLSESRTLLLFTHINENTRQHLDGIMIYISMEIHIYLLMEMGMKS